MKQDDSDIRNYFEGIKKEEQNHMVVPPFTMPKKRRKLHTTKWLVPIAVAASLLVLFSLYTPKATSNTPANALVITMTMETSSNTNDLLINEPSMSNWIAPTNILIQEFED